MKKIFALSTALLAFLALSLFSFAEGAPIDSGDTTWILVSSAIVFFMTPGLAFFYAGFVKKKNAVNTLTNTMVVVGIMSLQWIVIGYTLAFGSDVGGVVGGLDWLFLRGVEGAAPGLAIPHTAFVAFQMMFAIITPALIIGSLVERMRLVAVSAFMLLWGTLVYSPLVHWVWGGGWLAELGLLDFAGGIVVHTSAGVAGLIVALVLTKRKGYPTESFVPHNVPFILLGASILWLGWFGFNAGSALAADGIAADAFLNTNTAAAAALIVWMIIEKLHKGKSTLGGLSVALVVGLIAITPAAGFVRPFAALLIGAVAAVLSYVAIMVKGKLGYDDSLDVFAAHGVAGIWGTLATGLFATVAVNEAGANGLFYGNPGQFVTQLIGVVATIGFVAVMTFIILKVVSLFTRLTVDEKAQEEGLDTVVHGEEAYN
jgi:ammonium transporter, Amt family